MEEKGCGGGKVDGKGKRQPEGLSKGGQCFL